MKVELVLIDPQNDFCDPSGALFVPGADGDMKRTAAMIKRLSDKLDDIHVTLDSHRTVDIAHPIFWVNSQGQHPSPFTLISAQDVRNGVWRTSNPGMQKRGLEYVETLEKNKRYVLCIWPYHCIIGTWGHALYPELSDALLEWEKTNFGLVDYVTKGSNPFTEHYSAVQADVPDPEDENTQMNTALLDILAECDIVAISGEALSHCVANSVRDIADNFGDDNIKKLVLLEDTSSNVPGFDSLGESFVKDMTARGMQKSTSVDFLA